MSSIISFRDAREIQDSRERNETGSQIPVGGGRVHTGIDNGEEGSAPWGGQDATPTTMMHVNGSRDVKHARTRVHAPRLGIVIPTFAKSPRFPVTGFCRYLLEPSVLPRLLLCRLSFSLSLSLHLLELLLISQLTCVHLCAWQRCSPEAASKIRGREKRSGPWHTRDLD